MTCSSLAFGVEFDLCILTRNLIYLTINKALIGGIFVAIKDDILKEVIDRYLNSADYNGIPVYDLSVYSEEALCELIDEGKVEILSEFDVLNPHIKGFDIEIDKAIQKKNISSPRKYSVIYPTRQVLEGLATDSSAPYTQMMSKGSAQFQVIYFDIEILERYVNNPRFHIFDNGYRGSIYPKDEYLEDNDIDREYIKDYGMAYIDTPKLSRAIGVFACDLAKLTAKKQQLWHSFELENQQMCHIHPGFIKNLILGEWVTDVWALHAIIDEMKTINKLCEAVGIPPLFAHTYGTHFSEMPEGFRNILLPTKKNYYDFVLVLEKMLVHNISYKTFVNPGVNVKAVSRTNDEGEMKGSLQLLEDWLCANTSTNITAIQKFIVAPLKKIRKIRQKPAHELTSNEYNIDYYQEQFDLINAAYNSLASIRQVMSTHPLAKSVEIPQHLRDTDKIVNY